VASAEEDGDRPSRFTQELGVVPVEVTGRPRRPLSLTGIVAELRRTAADPATPAPLRDAAVRRLARLALERRGSAPLVPAADPATWWGTRSRSVSPHPLRPVDEPVSISPSTLDALLACPARWFLEHEAGGRTATTSAQGFGNIVHAVADRLTKGDLGPDTTEEQLMALVDRVWGEVVFPTPWSSTKQRAELERALRRLLAWHREDPRQPLASEVPLDADLRLDPDPDGEVVRLHGYADRLDVDEDGRVVVVDFKTSKSHPTANDLPGHVQLALYQLAVDQGAVDELLGRPGRSGGAELVQLRRDKPAAEAKTQRQEPPQPGPDGRTPVEVTIGEVVRRIRDEEFPARLGDHCKHCTFFSLCPHESSGTVLS
jgi:RecB family exonuclease